jgi:hypothetical protein
LLQHGYEQRDLRFRIELARFLTRHYASEVFSGELSVSGRVSQALDLSCTLSTRFGELVFLEEPSYYLALRIFADHGLRRRRPGVRGSAGGRRGVPPAHLLRRPPRAVAKSTWRQRFASLPELLWVLLVFVLIIGGLMKGFFTPTEAGSVGTFAVILLSLAQRGLNLKSFTKSLTEALRTACMVLMLIAGSTVLGHFLAVTKIPMIASEWVVALPVNRHPDHGVHRPDLPGGRLLPGRPGLHDPGHAHLLPRRREAGLRPVVVPRCASWR